MSVRKLALIVAMDEARLIGRDNQLPWRLPADLAWFKQTTMGKPIIMGRKTHESIGRPLPGRQNIVVSHNPDYNAEGCDVVSSVEQAVAIAEGEGEVMLIGGAQLYEHALPRAARIYLTEVHGQFEGDAWFPALNTEDWREAWREKHEADDKNDCAYSFVRLERV